MSLYRKLLKMKNLHRLCGLVAILFLSSVSEAQWFSWELRSNLTDAQLSSLSTDMIKRGFVPKSLSSSVIDDDFRYTSIWVKPPDPMSWQLRTRLLEKEFLAEVVELKTKGFYPFDISVSSYKGVPVFNGIWHHDPSLAWEWRINLSHRDAVKSTREFFAKGLIPTDVDGYEVNGEPLYSLIWSKSKYKHAKLAIGIAEADFSKWRLRRAKATCLTILMF